MIAQTFIDYLLPSTHDVPEIEIVHHCTPPPFTIFGQKGSGESGYLGAAAAISSAINNATSPLGVRFDVLPIRMVAIADAVGSPGPFYGPAKVETRHVDACAANADAGRNRP